MYLRPLAAALLAALALGLAACGGDGEHAGRGPVRARMRDTAGAS